LVLRPQAKKVSAAIKEQSPFIKHDFFFLFHHTLQKKRKWGWEWIKGGSGGGIEKAERGGTRKQNKTGRKSISLPLRCWVGREAEGRGGEGARKLYTEGSPLAHTHTPRICTVQTPDNYNSQRKEEEGWGSRGRV
jgi:hypothetical protein